MTNTIEASANSLKLSYLRFVSDSAPGLLLVLVVVVLDSHGLLEVRIIPHDTTDKAIGAILVVLLATPVGLLINGASHFLLGGAQRYIDRRCFTAEGWPVADTKDVLLFERWAKFFDLGRDDWPRVANEVDEILDTLVPHLAALLDHVRALKKFCRSIAFLAVVTAFIVAGWVGTGAAAGILVGMTTMVFAPRKWVRVAAAVLVSGSFAVVVIICCVQSVLLTVALVLLTFGFLLLGGLVDFYQHGLTMLFVYQLLVFDGGPLKITPAKVRTRLTFFVRSLKK